MLSLAKKGIGETHPAAKIRFCRIEFGNPQLIPKKQNDTTS